MPVDTIEGGRWFTQRLLPRLKALTGRIPTRHRVDEKIKTSPGRPEDRGGHARGARRVHAGRGLVLVEHGT